MRNEECHVNNKVSAYLFPQIAQKRMDNRRKSAQSAEDILGHFIYDGTIV
jgi:hypothetical protein